MQNKKVLLLGHTGFIGKTLFNQLNHSAFDVVGISSKEIDFYKNGSSQKLKAVLKKNTTLIIAIAINRELGDSLMTMQDNIRIISNIASALEKSKIKKCVYLSTADVYGTPEKLPITESTPIKPRSYYSIAKICSELLLELACKSSKTPFIIFRYNGVFGPGQKNFGYGPNYFINSIKKKGSVKIWGDGKEIRDTLYVNDLAKVIIAMGLSKHVGIYNIARGKGLSFIQMISLIKRVSPRKFTIEKRRRSSPSFDQIFDIRKFKKALPNFNFTPVKTAISETCKATFGSI